jgi:repressor LexA
VPKRTQDKILNYIQSYLQEHQIPPTLRDIQDHFSFSAIGTVQYHLKNLVKSGCLEIRPRLSRGITLTSKTLGIPILGSVPAGPAQLAFDDLQGYLSPNVLDNTITAPSNNETKASSHQSTPTNVDPRGLFALRIKGDSMIEAGIMNGDLVIVRPQSSGRNGDIVVARIADDEATVKRLVRKPGVIQLAPANPRYRPIPVDSSIKILGKVIRVVRQYS